MGYPENIICQRSHRELGLSSLLFGHHRRLESTRAVALLVPGFPRLKEWAYAGAFFNYSGAIASHLIVGIGAGELVYLFIQIVLLVVSWATRPSSRCLNVSPG